MGIPQQNDINPKVGAGTLGAGTLGAGMSGNRPGLPDIPAPNIWGRNGSALHPFRPQLYRPQ